MESIRGAARSNLSARARARYFRKPGAATMMMICIFGGPVARPTEQRYLIRLGGASGAALFVVGVIDYTRASGSDCRRRHRRRR